MFCLVSEELALCAGYEVTEYVGSFVQTKGVDTDQHDIRDTDFGDNGSDSCTVDVAGRVVSTAFQVPSGAGCPHRRPSPYGSILSPRAFPVGRHWPGGRYVSSPPFVAGRNVVNFRGHRGREPGTWMEMALLWSHYTVENHPRVSSRPPAANFRHNAIQFSTPQNSVYIMSSMRHGRKRLGCSLLTPDQAKSYIANP